MNISQREQTSPEPWRGNDPEPPAEQIDIALQVEPSDAQQWCRLGEYYDAQACRSGDHEMAAKYRERAVAALTQAITLDPALAKAHYVLANVYRAQDVRLALLEFEAAAKCDPQAYAEALSDAQKAVTDCTYRLCDLNLIVLECAQETPCADILEADFYFDDCTIRSAVLHTCVSQDERQHAKLWLFESASPDTDTDRPVAQLAVSSTGNIYVSAGCPASYDGSKAQIGRRPSKDASDVSTRREAHLIPDGEIMAASAVSASLGRERQRLPLWVPVGMMVLAFSSSLFAYLTLIAPAPARVDKHTGERNEATKRRALEAPSDEMPTILALAPERFRPTREDPGFTPELPPGSHSLARSPTPHLPTATQGSRPMKQQPTIRATPSRSTPMATAEGPAAIGATAAAALETKPARRSGTSAAGAAFEPSAPQLASSAQQDAALAAASLKEPPIIVPLQKELAAPVQLVQRDPPTAIRSVRSESPAPPSAQPESVRATSNWLSRMRAELDVCGKPGMWRSDLCRETVRWNYCHPNHWDAVRECTVERFASSAMPN